MCYYAFAIVLQINSHLEMFSILNSNNFKINYLKLEVVCPRACLIAPLQASRSISVRGVGSVYVWSPHLWCEREGYESGRAIMLDRLSLFTDKWCGRERCGWEGYGLQSWARKVVLCLLSTIFVCLSACIACKNIMIIDQNLLGSVDIGTLTV